MASLSQKKASRAAAKPEKKTSNKSSQKSLIQRAVKPEAAGSGGTKPPAYMQAKLAVSHPQDSAEKEADSVARQVATNTTTPSLTEKTSEEKAQRASLEPAITPEKKETMALKPVPAAEKVQRRAEPASTPPDNRQEKKEEPSSPPGKNKITNVQRKAGADSMAGQQTSTETENRIEARRGGGTELSGLVAEQMSRQFNCDFSNVRIHNDKEAAELCAETNARAFTVGNDIFFAPGEFAPDNAGGRELLAHELTHVAQQEQGNAEQRKIHRTTVTLNPVVISADPEKQQELQAQSDAMMARFPEVWRGFSRDWYDAALNALATVAEPANPYEASNFYKALAGNLLWAATSISVFGTGAKGAMAVIGTSVAGAGAGSGAFATPAPPSGRASVGAVLASNRDGIEQRGTRALFAEVATECISDPATATDVSAQDQRLWARFASSIPFESRATQMQVNATARLASWLQQFQDQYLAWKEQDDVITKAREYELAEIASGPFGSPFDAIADLLGIGTPADRFFDMAQRDIPFTPVFVN